MIQLYILTIHTDQGDVTSVFHNVGVRDYKKEMDVVRQIVRETYGDEVTFTFEMDVDNHITKTKFPEQYKTIMCTAMGHIAKYN